VGVFGPLKAAYRTQVEQHYRAGGSAKTVSRPRSNRQQSRPVDKTSARQETKEKAEREIQQWELGRYCAVLDL
jgi:hypothetical protein